MLILLRGCTRLNNNSVLVLMNADVVLKNQAPKKWGKDRKVWRRVDENKPFEFVMYVDDWKYNDERGGWDYKLRDEDGKVSGWVKETDTKPA